MIYVLAIWICILIVLGGYLFVQNAQRRNEAERLQAQIGAANKLIALLGETVGKQLLGILAVNDRAGGMGDAIDNLRERVSGLERNDEPVRWGGR